MLNETFITPAIWQVYTQLMSDLIENDHPINSLDFFFVEVNSSIYIFVSFQLHPKRYPN